MREVRPVRGLHLQGLHNLEPGAEVQDILLPFCPQFRGRGGLLELGDLQVRKGVSQARRIKWREKTFLALKRYRTFMHEWNLFFPKVPYQVFFFEYPTWIQYICA